MKTLRAILAATFLLPAWIQAAPPATPAVMEVFEQVQSRARAARSSSYALRARRELTWQMPPDGTAGLNRCIEYIAGLEHASPDRVAEIREALLAMITDFSEDGFVTEGDWRRNERLARAEAHDSGSSAVTWSGPLGAAIVAARGDAQDSYLVVLKDDAEWECGAFGDYERTLRHLAPAVGRWAEQPGEFETEVRDDEFVIRRTGLRRDALDFPFFIPTLLESVPELALEVSFDRKSARPVSYRVLDANGRIGYQVRWVWANTDRGLPRAIIQRFYYPGTGIWFMEIEWAVESFVPGSPGSLHPPTLGPVVIESRRAEGPFAQMEMERVDIAPYVYAPSGGGPGDGVWMLALGVIAVGTVVLFRRRRAVGLAVCVLLGLPVACGGGHEAVVSITPGAQDLPAIFDGERATATFEVRNEGGVAATGISVQSSCGCSIPTAFPIRLDPGESAPLKVEFDGTGRPGPNLTVIRLRAANVPVRTISFTVHVKQAVALPKLLDLGTVRRGNRHRFETDLTVAQGTRVVDARCNLPGVSVVVEGGKLRLDVEPISEVGPVFATLELRHEGATTGTASCPMRLNCILDELALPQAGIDFGIVARGKSARAEFALSTAPRWSGARLRAEQSAGVEISLLNRDEADVLCLVRRFDGAGSTPSWPPKKTTGVIHAELIPIDNSAPVAVKIPWTAYVP